MVLVLYVRLHFDGWMLFGHISIGALGCVMEQNKQEDHILIDVVADFHAIQMHTKTEWLYSAEISNGTAIWRISESNLFSIK